MLERMPRRSRCLYAGTVLLGTISSAQTYLIQTEAGTGPPPPFTDCFVGDGGLAVKAILCSTNAIAADPAGDVFFVDAQRIREVTAATDKINTIAGTGAPGFNGDGVATSTQIYSATGLAVDARGNLFIADTNNHRIRELVAASGMMVTIAGTSQAGYSGDQGLAIDAVLNQPGSLAFDSSGNLFIVDTNRLRRIDAVSGVITTVAGDGTLAYSGDNGPAADAQLNGAVSVAVDSMENLYIAEASRIRMISAATGIITTIAGDGVVAYSGDWGPASAAELYSPNAVAVDANGNLFIEEFDYSTVREISAATGIISTIAGQPLDRGFRGDGAPAQLANLYYPLGLAVNGNGDIFIADNGNDRVRELTPNGPAVPYIAANGIVSVDGDFDQIEAGSWASIYGVNLATGIATWNGDFPASLGGVTVSVNGKPAYLWYVSPTQINFQAPDDATLGNVTVTINNTLGSGSSTVQLATVAPAFLLFSSGFVAAVIPTPDGSGAYGNGTYDLAGPSGYLPFATRNVKQGETLILYGTGFGPTTPHVPAGQAFTSSAPTVNPVTISIGGLSANVAYAGLVGAGLYQFNVTVPDTTNGTLLIESMVDGVPADAGVTVQCVGVPQPGIPPCSPSP